ncbi:hypothetical protein I4U23_022170 [Adineta vaga]|nr:hypothetical protein I4U23_022170 [Adineta vaga]
MKIGSGVKQGPRSKLLESPSFLCLLKGPPHLYTNPKYQLDRWGGPFSRQRKLGDSSSFDRGPCLTPEGVACAVRSSQRLILEKLHFATLKELGSAMVRKRSREWAILRPCPPLYGAG